jgi:acetyl esterase
MSLDPEVKRILEFTAGLGLQPLYELPVDEARQRIRNGLIDKTSVKQVFQVDNLVIPCPDHEIPLRVYYPSGAQNLPCLIFLHGGGWTLSDLDTHDALCRSLTNDVNCVVISVDFRRAPENKFPAAIDDSYTALEWIHNNHNKLGIAKTKIGIGGDSSGANQAAVVAMLSRDRNGPNLLFQWLAYPVMDYHTPYSLSYTEMGSGYALNKELLFWFWDNYLPTDFSRTNPYIFPLQAINMSGLPSAYIMTANFDPLRDEGEAYGERLKTAGVNVKIRRFESQTHGFLVIKDKVNGANQAYGEAVIEMRRFFAL